METKSGLIVFLAGLLVFSVNDAMALDSNRLGFQGTHEETRGEISMMTKSLVVEGAYNSSGAINNLLLTKYDGFSPRSDVPRTEAKDNNSGVAPATDMDVSSIERLASEAEGSGNILEAVAYWEKARAYGSVKAARRLFQLYSRGSSDLPYDYVKAIRSAHIAQGLGIPVPELPHK